MAITIATPVYTCPDNYTDFILELWPVSCIQNDFTIRNMTVLLHIRSKKGVFELLYQNSLKINVLYAKGSILKKINI